HGKVLLGADPVKFFARPSEYYRAGEITVDHEKITIPHCYSTAGGWYYREDFLYLIMAM
ncbi:hypothetical protein G3A39_41615, partial [Paraburkholderia aspalathi]|nr:hypothetical protein [Paraburkholderia aspalathi]